MDDITQAAEYERRATLIRAIEPGWKTPSRWTQAYLASLADHQDNKAAECRKQAEQG